MQANLETVYLSSTETSFICWCCIAAFHFPDAHSIDLGGVINSLFSSDVTVIASNDRKTREESWFAMVQQGGVGEGRVQAHGTELTSILLCIGVRLSLSTNLLSQPHKLPRPDHQAVSAPPTVSSTESLCSHLTLVTWALCPTYFKSRMLALRCQRTAMSPLGLGVSLF